MVQALPVGPLVVYLGDGPPSTSDDSATRRARRGYLWADRSATALWLCVDPAEGAAVWHRLGDAEDLAAIALSGSWGDLSDTPTTLDGYGITDAATGADLSAHVQDTGNPHSVTAAQTGAVPVGRIVDTGTGLEGGGDLSEDRTLGLTDEVLASLAKADTAVQPGDLGSAAYEAVTAFDPAGAAAAAESNAIGYTQSALGELGTAAQHPAEDFAPAASVALLPVALAGPGSLQPADEGRLVLSEGHAVTLPASEAPGMYDGWRCVVKNTAGGELPGWGYLGASLTLHGAGGDLIDGQASVDLPGGAAVLVVRIAPGHYAII